MISDVKVILPMMWVMRYAEKKGEKEEEEGRKVPGVGTGELGKEAKKSGRIEQEQRKIKERKEGWSKRR